MNQESAAQLFRDAFALHQAGKIADAIGAYQKLIELDPQNAQALNWLAVAQIQAGRLEDALQFAQKAVAIQGDSADCHDTLGHAFQELDNPDKAIEAWRTAISLNPSHLKAHLSLGNALWEIGQYDEAVAVNQKALQLDPRSLTGLNNLGNALRAQGKFDEAIVAYRRAVLAAGGLDLMRDDQLKPAQPGHARNKKDVGMAKVPVRLAGDFATTCFNLAECHFAASNYEDAVPCYRAALEADPTMFKARRGLIIALVNLQEYGAAKKSWAEAAALAPDSALVHEALGEIQLHNLQAREAVESFRRAVKADPESVTALTRLGRALESLGKFEEAKECLKKRAEIERAVVRKHRPAEPAQPQTDTRSELERLEEMSRRPNLSFEDRISIEFALGNTLDEAERYDEAFPHFAEANALVKRQHEMAGEWYNAEKFHEGVGLMMSTFTPGYFAHRRDWGSTSEVPVFIVGMPRSGTTLLHQIAASHSQVHGAGELTLMEQIEAEFGGDSERMTLLHWGKDKVKQVAEIYLHRLRAMNATALRIVDKLPGNVVRIAQIATLFPRSRVIFCRRDARDTCLSCFFQWFTQGLDYTLDLRDCGLRQVETDRLVAHWLKVRPVAMMEMQYETLVNDLEGQSRRLIDFLGLPWEPACLEFYKAETAVLTASIRQVRKPIYNKSVGRWKNYEKHLGPLFQALGPEYTNKP
jgi:tetratricopeptide (TPR) repeat protein